MKQFGSKKKLKYGVLLKFICLRDGHIDVYRTINIISLLDCAFSFYQNYPCRLTHREMECDLPCEESLFRSDHPFAEPNFHLSRDITVFEAFQWLFAESQPAVMSETAYAQSNPQPAAGNAASEIKFTVLDMFILIHRRLYVPLPVDF
jgi:hypothetical protein